MTIWRGQYRTDSGFAELSAAGSARQCRYSIRRRSRPYRRACHARDFRPFGAGEIAGLLAREKALFVSSRNPDATSSAPSDAGGWLPAVQQTCWPGAGRRTIAPARRCGRTSCIPPLQLPVTARITFSDVSVVRVSMRALSGAEIRAYLDGGWRGCDIERRGLSARGARHTSVDHFEGDHFTILGLPLLPPLAFLRREQLLELSRSSRKSNKQRRSSH